MKVTTCFICFASAAALGFAQQSAATDVAATAAIRRILTRDWPAAAQAGDVDGYLGFLTDDMIVMLDNEPPLTSKPALAEWLRKAFAAGSYQINIHDPDEIVVNGDWAFARYNATIVAKLKAGETLAMDRKYLDVWKRQADGAWQCHRHMFNDNVPVRSQRTTRPNILDLREMTTVDFKRLNLKQTVVIVPGGVLEQHGPFLPAFTDGYQWETSARLLAEVIAGRPGWTVLLFPSIPLGEGGANQIGKRHVFPGTFHVHYPAMRAMYLDIASELGEAGFRWVFVVDSHGAPRHRLAISQAGEYFCDTYGGVMVNLHDLKPLVRRPINYGLTAEERAENALDIHGGMRETSWMLACRPDLVRQGYKEAKPQGGKDLLALAAIGTAADWPGYFGSPRLATAARGEAYFKTVLEDFTEIALRLLDGADLKTFERNPPIVDDADPKNRDWRNSADEHTQAILAKQAAWLARRGLN